MADPAGPDPSALSDTERAELLAVLNDTRFADKSPAQVWAILLDQGAYLASISTMYRVLRAEGQVYEAARPSHPPAPGAPRAGG